MKMRFADNLTASTTDSLPSITFDDDAFHDRCKPIGSNAHAIEIELQPEVFGVLSRRGRQRRLREIQSALPVSVRLDRQRKVLHAIGTPEALEAVQAQIESLRGPRKTVSSSVWAELMRTRVSHNDSSVLYRLEQASGCRIHIERKQNEVRLFGPPEASSAADKLLDEFATQVKEVKIDMDASQATEDSLHDVAHACGVTLRVGDGQVMVFGLHANVEKAATELNQRKSATGTLNSSCEGEALVHQVPVVPMDTRCLHSFQQIDPLGFGMVGPCPHESKPSPTAAAQPCHTPQPYMTYAPVQQLHAQKNVCATCGCGSFCTSCGAPIIGWQYMQDQVLPPCGPASSYPVNAIFVPMVMAQPSTHPPEMDPRALQWANSNSELQLQRSR